MNFQSKALPEFWRCYLHLPDEIQRRADKQFGLLIENPRHPSLQLKSIGGFWSARVTDDYRALAVLEKNVFTWFWIGPHDEYERILQS